MASLQHAALTLPSIGVTTSESFVQKLKGAADPIPVQGSSADHSIHKIELARIALDQSTQSDHDAQHVHIPRLDNVVLAWILDTLCNAAKASAKAASVPASSPLRTEAYYSLLQRLLDGLRSPLTPATIASLSPRSTPQTYLLILSSILQIEPSGRRICILAAAQPICRLLQPIASGLASSQASRATMDNLLGQVFGAACDLDGDEGNIAEALDTLMSVIGDAWIEAGIDNPSLEGKSQQHFVEKSLLQWLGAVSRVKQLSESDRTEHPAPFRSLHRKLFHIGQACLFSKMALRALLFSRASAGQSSSSLIEVLKGADVAAASLQALSDLVTLAVESLRRHSNELAQFARTQKRKASTAEAEDQEDPDSIESRSSLQLSLFGCFIKVLLDIPSLVVVQSKQHASAAAKSRTSILESILDTRIHTGVSNTTAWGDAMRSTAASILSDLRVADNDERSIAAVAGLRLLWKLDEEVVRHHLEEAFAVLGQQRTNNAETSLRLRNEVQSLLNELFASFARSQELPFIFAILSRMFEAASQDLWCQESLFTPRALTATVSGAVRDYVSPTQIVGILEHQADTLERLTTPKSNEQSEPKFAIGSKRPHGDTISTPLATCNVLRFAHPILAAARIPSAVAEDAWRQVERILEVCKTTIQDAAYLKKGTAPEQRQPKKAKGSSKAAQCSPEWPAVSYKTASAALWCCYGICSGARNMDHESATADLQRSGAVPAALSSHWLPIFAMVDGERPDEAQEELRIEIARMLLVWTELCLAAGEDLSTVAGTPGVDAFWGSAVERLAAAATSTDPTASEAALWEMLARRWLITLDRHSPHPRILPTAARLLVRSVCSRSPLATISRDVCRNAEFHELPHWRSTLVETLLQETQSKDQQQNLQALSALALLPIQYVPADSREILMVRATAESVAPIDAALERERVAVQTWLTHIARMPGRFSDKVAESVRSCLPALVSEQGSETELDKTCGDLLGIWLQKLLTHQQLQIEQLNSLIATAAERPLCLSIIIESLIQTSSPLAKELDVGSYDIVRLPSYPAGSSLFGLSHHLKQTRLTLSLARVGQVEDQLRREASAQVAKDAFAPEHITAAGQLLTCNTTGQGVELLREYLEFAATCADVEAPDVGPQACLAFARLLGSDRRILDGELLAPLEQVYNRFLARLSPDDYQRCIDALLRVIETAGPAPRIELRSHLAVIGLSLKFGPEGTLVIAQKHFTRLLTRIQGLLRAGDLDVLAGSLSAMESVCNGRAMLIRPVDATLLLSILSDVLSAKSQGRTAVALEVRSNSMTPSRIFSAVVNVTGSIIRLRLDVLIPVLPQLGALLVQMPPLFRRPLPNASSAQRQRLNATLPSWLTARSEAARSSSSGQSGSTPEVRLSSEDARDFARLLDTLTAKTSSLHGPAHGQGGRVLTKKNGSTIARGSKGDSGATSSLAKPFSKHAIYAILSYIHALLPSTALGSHIPTQVKATLRTGCVGLCGIVGEVERDWVLGGSELLGGAGEDAMTAGAGKGVLKDLWREWERSRYKGA